MTALLLVLAIALDSLTFALVWPHGEANPIIHALGAPAALLVRWLLIAAVIGLAYLARKYRRVLRPLLLVGAWSGVVGAATNVWTVAG